MDPNLLLALFGVALILYAKYGDADGAVFRIVHRVMRCAGMRPLPDFMEQLRRSSREGLIATRGELESALYAYREKPGFDELACFIEHCGHVQKSIREGEYGAEQYLNELTTAVAAVNGCAPSNLPRVYW